MHVVLLFFHCARSDSSSILHDSSVVGHQRVDLKVKSLRIDGQRNVYLLFVYYLCIKGDSEWLVILTGVAQWVGLTRASLA